MADTTEKESLLRLMDSLKAAAGSAHQLSHAQRNPFFLAVRDMLEVIHSNCVKVATQKAVPQQQILKMLDARARQIAH